MLVLAVIVTAGLVVNGLFFWKIRQDELGKFKKEFETEAAIRAHLIQDGFGDCLLVIRTLEQLFYASSIVEPHEFTSFARPLLKRAGGMSAVAWVPAVPHDQRETFERFGRKIHGPGFAISVRESEGAYGHAGVKESYYPLFYVEPREARLHRDAGLDLGSSPELVAAFEKAARTGNPVASGKDDLLKDGRRVLSFVAPVYGRDAGSGDEGRTRGAASGFIVAFLQEDAIHEYVARIMGSHGLTFTLLDASVPESVRVIARGHGRTRTTSSWKRFLLTEPPQYAMDFAVADRTWRLLITAGRGYMEQHYPLVFWLFLPGGVMLTLLFGLYVFSVLFQRERLEYLVNERTAELHSSEEEYRRLVENANEAIFVLQDEAFKFVNPKMCRILGHACEDLLDARIEAFIHPDDRDMVMGRHRRRMRGEDVPSVYPFRIVNGSGGIVWVEVNAIVIQWAGRTATLNFLMDISERVQAEEQRRSLEIQLAQAQKMESIGTLAGGIAHDFNNILSSVLGYAGLARMKKDDGMAIDDELDQIMKAGIRARDLVQQILTFSRRTEIRKDAVNLVPIVKETLKLIRASLPSTIEIRQNLVDTGAAVMSDPTQIHQIVMNLSTNASHAMKDMGGVLTVDLVEADLDRDSLRDYHGLEPGRYFRMSVSDTGTGIPGTLIHKIFDPFFTTKERGEGTGMGLSVVHGIVKDMGGAISVFSEPGMGTTFHILLPVSGAAQGRKESGRMGLKRGSGRILLVDDEEGVLETGKGILERLGYSVTVAPGSAEALEIFQAGPGSFDIVITDMTMPRMTGLELSESIHGIRPEVPVVLCTGFGFGVVEERLKNAGIRDMVMKPMIPEELADVVYRALNPGSLQDCAPDADRP